MTIKPFAQITFTGMPRPKRPTIRDEAVALRIAERLVAAVNIDDFYWEADESPDRVLDVQQEIMRVGRVATVFHRLWKRRQGDYGSRPYDWEGLDEHCRTIADQIVDEELIVAISRYNIQYRL